MRHTQLSLPSPFTYPKDRLALDDDEAYGVGGGLRVAPDVIDPRHCTGHDTTHTAQEQSSLSNQSIGVDSPLRVTRGRPLDSCFIPLTLWWHVLGSVGPDLRS